MLLFLWTYILIISACYNIPHHHGVWRRGGQRASQVVDWQSGTIPSSRSLPIGSETTRRDLLTARIAVLLISQPFMTSRLGGAASAAGMSLRRSTPLTLSRSRLRYTKLAEFQPSHAAPLYFPGKLRRYQYSKGRLRLSERCWYRGDVCYGNSNHEAPTHYQSSTPAQER